MPTSADLIRRHGVTTTDLFRWRRAGWIIPERLGRGGHPDLRHDPERSRTWWPAWVDRMVDLLALEKSRAYGAGKAPDHGGLFRAVAVALAAAPEAGWLVSIDGGGLVACDTAEEVAAVCAGVELVASIVAVPSLDASSRVDA